MQTRKWANREQALDYIQSASLTITQIPKSIRTPKIIHLLFAKY